MLIPNKYPIRKLYAYTFLLILFLLAGSSCRSHKKPKVEETVIIEETIEVKKPGKKKEKTLREKIVEEALTWEGTPYAYGRSDKGKATDCSGMVIVVYEEVAGMKLPRNSAKQAEFCEEVREKDVLPGDLVFFATGSDKKAVSHVGIMIDKIRFVHASGSKGVIISEMTTPYYNRCFIKYGRAVFEK